MKAEIRKQFIPDDYEMLVHKKLQNHKQRDLDIRTYTQEFHNLTLRAKVYETKKKKLERYMNGLKYIIQDELPIFHGKLDSDECVDWIEALDSHFECD